MVLTLGHFCVDEKCFRIDRVSVGRLLQHPLGRLRLVGLEQRAAVQRHHVARAGVGRRHAFERLERLAQRIAAGSAISSHTLPSAA